MKISRPGWVRNHRPSSTVIRAKGNRSDRITSVPSPREKAYQRTPKPIFIWNTHSRSGGGGGWWGVKDTALRKAGFIYRPSRQITREAGEGRSQGTQSWAGTPPYAPAPRVRYFAGLLTPWAGQRRAKMAQAAKTPWPVFSTPSRPPVRVTHLEPPRERTGKSRRGLSCVGLFPPPPPMTLQGPACMARCELPTPGEGGESPDPREREKERWDREPGRRALLLQSAGGSDPKPPPRSSNFTNNPSTCSLHLFCFRCPRILPFSSSLLQLPRLTKRN